MSLKILGGKLRGFEILVPNSSELRPTSVMLRRRLFDAHQNLSEHIFVDLCAGTGAVGIEAYSRGAEHIFFYENNKKIIRFLSDNIDRVWQKYNDAHLEIVSSSFEKFLKEMLEHFDTQKKIIIFFDPPYELHRHYELFFKILPVDCFKARHIQIWIESDTQKGPALDDYEMVKQFEVKRFVQGTQFVSILTSR